MFTLLCIKSCGHHFVKGETYKGYMTHCTQKDHTRVPVLVLTDSYKPEQAHHMCTIDFAKTHFHVDKYPCIVEARA